MKLNSSSFYKIKIFAKFLVPKMGGGGTISVLSSNLMAVNQINEILNGRESKQRI